MFASAAASRQSWRVRRRVALENCVIPRHIACTQPFVCFIASHVDSERRAEAIKSLLSSARVQIGGTPLIAVSWSAALELRQRVRALFAAQSSSGLPLIQLEQPYKTSQFEHLRALTSSCLPPPVWVLFSDDDDLWSEQRCELYRQQARLALQAVAPPGALVCRRKCHRCERSTARASTPRNANDVRALIASSQARLTDCRMADQVGHGGAAAGHNMTEYFDVAVRFGVLQSFFARVPRCVTRHRLCDLAFCSLVVREARPQHFMPASDDFVYYYSRYDQQTSASTVTPTAADAEMAQAAFEHAPDAVRSLFTAVAGDADVTHEVITFVARLREGIEQEFIVHRATTAVLPGGLAHGVCCHQANENCTSYVAAHPAVAAAAAVELAEWTRLLATGPICEWMVAHLEFEAIADDGVSYETP